MTNDDDPRTITQNLPKCPSVADKIRRQLDFEMDDAFSWGAMIFNTNYIRLMNVYEGHPIAYSSKHFKNPDNVLDTVARIVNPGGINDRDEEHCFDRIRRALLQIPEAAVNHSDDYHKFRLAVLEEISLLMKHNPCAELIDYWMAFTELISFVFAKGNAHYEPEEYRKLLGKYCQTLITTRQLLFKHYLLEDTKNQTDIRWNFEAKVDQAVQTICEQIQGAVQNLGTKIDDNTQKSIHSLGERVRHAKSVIIDVIKDNQPGTVKEAMLQRAIEQMHANPQQPPRETWKSVFNEYAGIPGAHLNFDAFRKQIERHLKSL